jgi:hypothetical protein
MFEPTEPGISEVLIRERGSGVLSGEIQASREATATKFSSKVASLTYNTV